MQRTPLTFQQHVLREQSRFPGATGEFSWLLGGITLATKYIQAAVRKAGLIDVLGAAGSQNVQGEQQQRLDVLANEALIESLSVRENVAMLVSEENDEPQVLTRPKPGARYAVIFDPLDGSSNIDVNVSVGTIFSILRLPDDLPADARGLLVPGHHQVAAGYVNYGSSTILVYSAGNGVHSFTLDPEIGAYVLSREHIRMPSRGPYYSVNAGWRQSFPPPYQQFLDRIESGRLGAPYGLRYTGSLVADVHRTLLKGGIFLYPETQSHPQGKLRLLYEVNPIAMLIEQAGGIALSGTRRALDILPTGIHQRASLSFGSTSEMQALQQLLTPSHRDE
jgi:fructose-1,6-bisphosphatase I